MGRSFGTVKVYISSDMEGTAGVVLWEQVLASSEFERFRRLMTQEINAAVEGALAAGAESVVVNDSHGPMTNIVIEDLHRDAELISGVNKGLLQVEGIGDGFDALFFTGYHLREGGGDGVLNHTLLGNTVYEIRVNGDPVDEAALNAAVAGVFGVPVALVSGDNLVCADAERRFPGVVTAPTKQAIDRYAARSLAPKKAQALIRERAAAAVEAVRSGQARPFVFAPPIRIEVDFKVTSSAHMTSLIPGVERIGTRSIAITSDDYLTAYRTLIVAALFGSHTSQGKL
jgi:D-amino peptidase